MPSLPGITTAIARVARPAARTVIDVAETTAKTVNPGTALATIPKPPPSDVFNRFRSGIGSVMKNRYVRTAGLMAGLGVASTALPDGIAETKVNRDAINSSWRKTAMTIPAEAFKAKGSGLISDEGMASLEKTAAILSPALAGDLRHALVMGGAHLALGAGAAGASALGKAVLDKATFQSDLKKIFEVNPKIPQMYESRDIILAYTSLRNLAPQLAKDPLVAASLLEQILRTKLTEDPAPRMDLQQAKTLTETNARMNEEDPVQRLLMTSGMEGLKGFQNAGKERRASEAKQQQQANQRRTPKARMARFRNQIRNGQQTP